MNELHRAPAQIAPEPIAPETAERDTQRQARRIYIAFCCAATLFMALIVLVATLAIMG